MILRSHLRPLWLRAADGAVHGASNLRHDRACKIAGTASLHGLVQLIAAIKNRAPEGRDMRPLNNPALGDFRAG